MYICLHVYVCLSVYKHPYIYIYIYIFVDFLFSLSLLITFRVLIAIHLPRTRMRLSNQLSKSRLLNRHLLKAPGASSEPSLSKSTNK